MPDPDKRLAAWKQEQEEAQANVKLSEARREGLVPSVGPMDYLKRLLGFNVPGMETRIPNEREVQERQAQVQDAQPGIMDFVLDTVLGRERKVDPILGTSVVEPIRMTPGTAEIHPYRYPEPGSQEAKDLAFQIWKENPDGPSAHELRAHIFNMANNERYGTPKDPTNAPKNVEALQRFGEKRVVEAIKDPVKQQKARLIINKPNRPRSDVQEGLGEGIWSKVKDPTRYQ